MEEVIKSYKGFNKDMTCRGFQYEEGEEYEEETAEVCKKGFHACEYPLDVFRHYYPAGNVFHEVEQSGVISKENDGTKVASSKIKIGASISIAGLVKAAIEYTTKRVNPEVKSNEKHGASSATGYKSSAEANDPCAVAVAWVYNGKVRGVLGSHLVLAEWEGDENNYWIQEMWTLKGAKMRKVDGKHIKPNVWYTLIDGKFTEVE